MLRRLIFNLLVGIFVLLELNPLSANLLGSGSSCYPCCDPCCEPCCDPCCEPCCEPCCPVLVPCQWSIMSKGGAAFSHFTHRGPDFFSVVGGAPATDPAITLNNTGRFRDHFQTPWETGGEIAWNASDRVQLFAEGFYQCAKGKNFTFLAGPFEITQSFTRFKNWGAYLGGRYYLCTLCSRLSPFIGFKAGILQQEKVDFTLTILGLDLLNAPYYFEQWVPSVGAQIGVDIKFRCNWSFVVIGEAVVTQGLKTNHNAVFTNPVATTLFTNLNIGDTGKVFSFPVTGGLRYNF